MNGWVGGWIDGWVGGWKSRFKDCLQQSSMKSIKYVKLLQVNENLIDAFHALGKIFVYEGIWMTAKAMVCVCVCVWVCERERGGERECVVEST